MLKYSNSHIVKRNVRKISLNAKRINEPALEMRNYLRLVCDIRASVWSKYKTNITKLPWHFWCPILWFLISLFLWFLVSLFYFTISGFLTLFNLFWSHGFILWLFVHLLILVRRLCHYLLLLLLLFSPLKENGWTETERTCKGPWKDMEKFTRR